MGRAVRYLWSVLSSCKYAALKDRVVHMYLGQGKEKRLLIEYLPSLMLLIVGFG